MTIFISGQKLRQNIHQENTLLEGWNTSQQ